MSCGRGKKNLSCGGESTLRAAAANNLYRLRPRLAPPQLPVLVTRPGPVRAAPRRRIPHTLRSGGNDLRAAAANNARASRAPDLAPSGRRRAAGSLRAPRAGSRTRSPLEKGPQIQEPPSSVLVAWPRPLAKDSGPARWPRTGPVASPSRPRPGGAAPRDPVHVRPRLTDLQLSCSARARPLVPLHPGSARRIEACVCVCARANRATLSR